MTDGLFHKVFNEIAAEYPEIQNEHLIVDIGTARLADTPEIFDVIVTPNLYGDIISDVAAQVAGSIGLAGSANYGDNGAMFEAVHGSAPSIAGQNIANPSGLIQAATLMLLYIGQNEVAEKIQNAWLRTIEDGIHTFDIFTEGVSKERVGTKQFAEAVIQRLGERPQVLKPVSYGPNTEPPNANVPFEPTAPAKKDLVGVDVYIDWHYNRIPDAVAEVLEKVNGDGLVLTMISNRGVKVWPGGFTETFCTDSWRCRFMRTDTGTPLKPEQVVSLLHRIDEHKLDFGKIENLYNFDGEPGYALSQGE
jgi:isocitrate dehydrogenase